jgi:hypothetical protein
MQYLKNDFAKYVTYIYGLAFQFINFTRKSEGVS